MFDRIDQMAREVKKDRARSRRAYEREHGRSPEQGWTAPVAQQQEQTEASAAGESGAGMTAGRPSSADTPANAPDEKPGDGKIDR